MASRPDPDKENLTMTLRPDDVHRTVLLAAHDGTQPTLEAAIAAHNRTGIMICADKQTCRDTSGQAAILTAVVTARRAFGTVTVHAEDPAPVLTTGIFKGQGLADALVSQGTRLLPTAAPGAPGGAWPVLLLGQGTPVPPGKHLAALRASWRGWTARVAPAGLPGETAGTTCVLAPIAAAALGVSEAFGAVRSAPGSEAGYRDISVNLWNPGADHHDNGPDLSHAPAAWWLVGLGHLGQASAWVISWLPYANPAGIEAVLQDTGRTTPANYSTGVLTPEGSDGIPKTRIAAAALENAGLTTRIIERHIGSDFRAAPGECHVALLGIDNLPTRRLISGAGWTLAIDTGLGDQPGNFDSILIHRFPGRRPSDQIPSWQPREPDAVTIPQTPAFADLQEHHDLCGVTELAGKAVGAAFVGVTAGCLATAEALRDLHGGTRHDTLLLSLTTTTARTSPGDQAVRVPTARLKM
jgi:hypothetical protein